MITVEKALFHWARTAEDKNKQYNNVKKHFAAIISWDYLNEINETCCTVTQYLF